MTGYKLNTSFLANKREMKTLINSLSDEIKTNQFLICKLLGVFFSPFLPFASYLRELLV
jgi:hypothetical protein